MAPRSLYRIVAVAEYVTWTLLILGMVLKYAVRIGDWPVLVAGSLHGLVFLSYGATAVLVGLNQRWPIRRIVAAVLTAVVPYATVPFDAWLERHRMLDGVWRTEASDDPRDQRWPDPWLRWMLARPVLLAVALVAVVGVVMVTLLVIGPAGGRAA